MEAVFELGHDPEVAAASAERPEQLRIAVLAGDDDGPIGRHDLRPNEVVAGQPGRTHEKADAAGQGQATDPGVDERPAGGRKVVRNRGPIEVLPQSPARCPRPPSRGVDLDRAHLTQVDHQGAVGHRMSGNAMAAPTHGDGQAGSTRGTDRADDVLRRPAHHDRGRMMIDRPVECAPRRVVSGSVGHDDPSRDRAI